MVGCFIDEDSSDRQAWLPIPGCVSLDLGENLAQRLLAVADADIADYSDVAEDIELRDLTTVVVTRERETPRCAVRIFGVRATVRVDDNHKIHIGASIDTMDIMSI
jgi:hypothetical protein